MGLRGLHRLRRVGLPAGARARPAAPHQPRRALGRRPRSPARGHRVAGADARVGQPRPRRPPGLADQAARAAPGHHPRRRRAAHPVHQRDPRRHRRVRGRPHGLAGGAGGGARRARPPAGGDPAELRPPPPLLRRGAGRDRHRRGRPVLAHRPLRRTAPRPARVGDARGDRGHEAPRGRDAAPDARHRHPGAAQPRRLVARARRRRGHGPRRPERQRRPHLARASLPVAPPGAQAPGAGRRGADRAPVRLRALHRPRVGRAGRARRRQDEVLELHPAPRLGPDAGARDPLRSRGRRDHARARRRAPHRGRAHRALRRNAPGGHRGPAPGRRRAARRARGRDRDLRRQPQHQRLERLHRGLRVLRLRPGQALARRLRARPRGVRAGACSRPSTTAPRRSACSRASIPTGRSRTTCSGCA